VDVRESLAECRECFEPCQLAPLARLTRELGIRTLVALRSHIAYDIARRESPDLILATACGDRLIKALRSVPEVPSLLTLLTDMDRMCVNAVTDLEWMATQLRRVVRLRARVGVPDAAGSRTATARAKQARVAEGP
jgi:hypothetical protein